MRSLLCFSLLLLAAAAAPQRQPANATFSVVGYLPEWRYSGANFDTLFKHLSHLLFFSVEPLPDGRLTGLDRLPDAETLAAAHAARATHGTKLLLCLGGNGRSAGFGPAARRPDTRKRLVASIVELVLKLDLDGWDCNWEYPGFTFGGGYASDGEVAVEWDAHARLLSESRKALEKAFKPRGRTPVVTAAYYPDGRQERLLAERKVADSVALLHAMAYDAPGAQGHSPFSLAEQVVSFARAAGLPLRAVALGLPMYGRNSATGDWTTYEDLVRGGSLPAETDELPAKSPRGAVVSFNGAATLRRKTALALHSGLGGVMVWESGQDCRPQPVTRGGATHVRTCPGEGEEASLHAAISGALAAGGAQRAHAPPPPLDEDWYDMSDSSAAVDGSTAWHDELR